MVMSIEKEEEFTAKLKYIFLFLAILGVSAIPGEMYFNRLTNIPSKTGTITITTGSSQKIITIGATGNVSVSGTSASSNYNLNVTVSSGGTVTSSPGTNLFLNLKRGERNQKNLL
jgi:hypothetical protein